jgi:hypothetical protein
MTDDFDFEGIGDLDPGLDFKGRLRGVVDAMIYLMPPDMRRRAHELCERYPDPKDPDAPKTRGLTAEPGDMIGYWVGPEDSATRLFGFHASALLPDDEEDPGS